MQATHPAPGLIEAAQRGEAGAIETLLAATKPDLQRFARRLRAGQVRERLLAGGYFGGEA